MPMPNISDGWHRRNELLYYIFHRERVLYSGGVVCFEILSAKIKDHSENNIFVKPFVLSIYEVSAQ